MFNYMHLLVFKYYSIFNKNILKSFIKIKICIIQIIQKYKKIVILLTLFKYFSTNYNKNYQYINSVGKYFPPKSFRTKMR